MATSPVPFGYQIVPQSSHPGQRVIYLQPSPRPTYHTSALDLDDEEEEYVPIRSPAQRASRFVEDLCDSPELDEFSATTRRIRRDAESALQRVSSSKPAYQPMTASNYFKNYDFERIYGPPRTPTERVTRATTPISVADDDDELDHLVRRKAYRGHGGNSLSAYGPRSTGTSLVTNKIKSIYRDLDEPVPFSCAKSPEHLSATTSALLSDFAGAKVRTDVNTKAFLREPPSSSSSSGYRSSGSFREPRTYTRNPDQVKNNISIRAQYAAVREAANRGIRKNNDYLMP